jgi:hypothetical protein
MTYTKHMINPPEKLTSKVKVDVRCAVCSTFKTAIFENLKKTVDKHGAYLCNPCSIRKTKADWLEPIKKVLADGEDLPALSSAKIKVGCPSCKKVFTVIAANLLRRKESPYFGYCRKCHQNTPEVKAVLSASHTGISTGPRSAETKEKLSKLQKDLWSNPEYYNKRKTQLQKMWADPCFKEKHLKASLAEEVIQQRKESLKKTWECDTKRKEASERTKALWCKDRESRLATLRSEDYRKLRSKISKALIDNNDRREIFTERINEARLQYKADRVEGTIEKIQKDPRFTCLGFKSSEGYQILCNKCGSLFARRNNLDYECPFCYKETQENRIKKNVEKISQDTRFTPVDYKEGQYHVLCNTCSQTLSRKAARLDRDCPSCYNANTAKTENKLKEWIESYGFSTQKIKLNRKEVDIFIPELKLGVEYCGLYWHCENSLEPRNSTYHYNKFKNMEKEGYQLITIFEDEWLTRQSQVKGVLLSLLQKNETRVAARKCVISEINKTEAYKFLDTYHLQGASKSFLNLGLFFQDKLIGVMTGGAHHRAACGLNVIILNRMCFESNTTVVGGASKLFKTFCLKAKAMGFTSVISWSDNRWSEGKVYEKLGFSLEQELPPDYSYVKRQKRFSKQSLKKTPEERLLGKTELELRREQGFDRIWDCGKKRWVFNL